MAASTPRPSELRGAEPTRALVWLLRASLVVLVAVGGVFLGHPPAIAVVAPTPTSSASTSYDVRGSVAHAGEVAVLRHRVGVAAREESLSLQGETARVSDSVVAAESADDAIAITRPYARPTGATTPAQRAAVQGQPCVGCGQIAERQVADHIEPLVQEYFRTGSIDLTRMRSLDAVQPQCPTCSARQGAMLSRWSRMMRDALGLE